MSQDLAAGGSGYSEVSDRGTGGATFAATVMIIAGTGCKHTAHGVGEDVEKMGEKIQEKTK